MDLELLLGDEPVPNTAATVDPGHLTALTEQFLVIQFGAGCSGADVPSHTSSVTANIKEQNDEMAGMTSGISRACCRIGILAG
jgi:hypothetical protein